VDGLEKPWCYYGTGDGDWDYCDESCGSPDAPPPPPKCTTTVTGKTCDKWGENEFGLDPSSNTCEQVDGLDKPWCYTSGEEWDFCNCKTPAKKKSAPRGPVEPGCDEDREENQKLRDQVKEFKSNKKSLEMQSKWPLQCCAWTSAASPRPMTVRVCLHTSCGAPQQAGCARTRRVTAGGLGDWVPSSTVPNRRASRACADYGWG
jgi:hypothetical protein